MYQYYIKKRGNLSLIVEEGYGGGRIWEAENLKEKVFERKKELDGGFQQENRGNQQGVIDAVL